MVLMIPAKKLRLCLVLQHLLMLLQLQRPGQPVFHFRACLGTGLSQLQTAANNGLCSPRPPGEARGSSPRRRRPCQRCPAGRCSTQGSCRNCGQGKGKGEGEGCSDHR